eukprot:3933515-Amphidinium_carterae.1
MAHQGAPGVTHRNCVQPFPSDATLNLQTSLRTAAWQERSCKGDWSDSNTSYCKSTCREGKVSASHLRKQETLRRAGASYRSRSAGAHFVQGLHMDIGLHSSEASELSSLRVKTA